MLSYKCGQHIVVPYVMDMLYSHMWSAYYSHISNGHILTTCVVNICLSHLCRQHENLRYMCRQHVLVTCVVNMF
jgi:hypothetical protein